MKCPNCTDGNAAPVDDDGGWIRCSTCGGSGHVNEDGTPLPLCQMQEAGRPCNEPRWTHPERGRLCVCAYHYGLIEAGVMRVPPLRRNIDYISTGRKTFLVGEAEYRAYEKAQKK